MNKLRTVLTLGALAFCLGCSSGSTATRTMVETRNQSTAAEENAKKIEAISKEIAAINEELASINKHIKTHAQDAEKVSAECARAVGR